MFCDSGQCNSDGEQHMVTSGPHPTGLSSGCITAGCEVT